MANSLRITPTETRTDVDVLMISQAFIKSCTINAKKNDFRGRGASQKKKIREKRGGQVKYFEKACFPSALK